MKQLIARLLIAICLGTVLSHYLPKQISEGLIQALFTVLGIVFSIAMGLLVSFNLSSVLNDDFRKDIRSSIESTRNWLLIDFAISTLAFAAGVIYSSFQFFIKTVCIRLEIICIALIIISLVYEIYNFRLINKLRIDIEERLIKEENKRRDISKGQ